MMAINSRIQRLTVYEDLLRLGARNNIIKRFFPSPHIAKLIGEVEPETPPVRGGVRRFLSSDGLLIANSLYNRLAYLEPDNADARRQIKPETLLALTKFARLSLPHHAGTSEDIDCNRVAVLFDLIREGRFCKATCNVCGESFLRSDDSVVCTCVKCKFISAGKSKSKPVNNPEL
ncbi:hypothetical protein [Motilimonas eburnea]|uniref:hypothetical protein n=1 Tax=Motilimonas eburnea TaxID=1737488 RepID=UPI001E4BB7E0|nr:hypothetical protein [Motilimonas eburnea]MCE2571780.1 hypothetical protein [Motilimonas eburnea]